MNQIPLCEIKTNIDTVLGNIASAAVLAGRTPEDISLVAASKMNDTEHVRYAVDCGIKVCGENRVQEMLEKNSLGAYDSCSLHFIGHLQRNKVKSVVGLAKLIHSADSLSLIDAISKHAVSIGMVQDILLEINIAGEPSKSGFHPEDIVPVIEHCEELSGIRVRGLMAIPPACINPEENRPFFARMRQLFIDIGAEKYDNSNMDFLSMGMSRDYQTAISCGSNMVRIGTGIFGERDYGHSL